MNKDEALKLALDALEPEFYLAEWYVNEHVIPAAIAAIKTVLAQPEPIPASDTSEKRVDETAKQRHEQEPVAFPDAPKTIYLQVGNECPDDAHWGELVDVCWCDEQVFDNDIVYVRADTIPPQRKPLTDEEILHQVDTHVGGPSPSYPLDNSDWLNFARAIEAKLKEKNT